MDDCQSFQARAPQLFPLFLVEFPQNPKRILQNGVGHLSEVLHQPAFIKGAGLLQQDETIHALKRHRDF